MSNNPFASFEINIPKQYKERVKKYCRTANSGAKAIEVPFERQIDFWFMAFLIAVNKELTPVAAKDIPKKEMEEKDPSSDKEKETSGVIAGHILNTDPKRVSFMQLTVLGITGDFEMLSNHRAVFNYCLELANAGIPELIQILSDPDDLPLWSILGELESRSKIKS
jgi:hypothetical protein